MSVLRKWAIKVKIKVNVKVKFKVKVKLKTILTFLHVNIEMYGSCNLTFCKRDGYTDLGRTAALRSQ